MNTKLLLLLNLTIAMNVRAGSATWSLNPTSDDWNTASNWMPNTVPNGPADVATFENSNEPNLFLSAVTEVSEVVFNPGASAFTITTTDVNIPLIISGPGVTNNSGITQN